MFVDKKNSSCNTIIVHFPQLVWSLIVVVILLIEILIEEKCRDFHVGHVWYQWHHAVVLRQIKILNIWFDVNLRLVVGKRGGDWRVCGWRMMRRRWSQAHNVWWRVLVHWHLTHHRWSWRNHLWRHHLTSRCDVVHCPSSRNYGLYRQRRIGGWQLLVWLIYAVTAVNKIWICVATRIVDAYTRVWSRLTALKMSLHSLMLFESSALDKSISTNSANIRLKWETSLMKHFYNRTFF